MKRCGFVIRVSTDRQAQNEEGSLKNQLQRLKAHVDYKNMAEGKREWMEAATYVLKGVSGKDSFRSPEFARLFDDIKTGRVNTLCCTALDRISRSVKDFLNFFEILTQYNVEFVCLKQNYDTTSSQGKLFITIMMALAEFEREQTSERNRDATLARAERGLWNGGHLTGYDLDSNRKGYLTVNEREKALVRFAFTTYLECGSICETVKRLNRQGYRTKAYTSRRGQHTPPKPFAYSSVHRILTNLAYTGQKEINKRWKKEDQAALPEKRRYRLVKSVWEPLIDVQTFNQTQLLLEKNYSSKHNAAKAIKHVYLLNGSKLWCGECGSEMEGGSGTGRLRQKYYYYLCKNNTCKFRVPAVEIEGFVVRYIKALASAKDALKEIILHTNTKLQTELPRLVSERDNLEAELESTKKFAEGILDQWTSLATDENALFLKDKLSELGKRRKEIENGLSNLEIMIEEIRRESISQDMVGLLLARFSEVFHTLKPYQQKELINITLHKAILSRTETKIALYGKQTDTRLFDLTDTQNVDENPRPGISEWLPSPLSKRTSHIIFLYMPIHIRYDSKRRVSIVEGEAPYQISTNERITKTLLKRHKPIISKPNPIKAALEYEKYYKSLPEPSMSKVGEHFGVSRVRVCQVLNLLKLDKRIVDYVASITDSKENNFWTERKLRKLSCLDQNSQWKIFRNIP